MLDLEEYFSRNIQHEKLTETLKKAINFYGPYMVNNLVENQCDLFLSDKKKGKRAGEFNPLTTEIHLFKVRDNLENGTLDCIYVHELGHFMDRVRRSVYSRYKFASSSRNTKERTIITLYRSKMVPFPEKRTNYRGRTCELFARSLEEYYALKTNNSHWMDVHKNWDYYVDFEEFRKTISPVVADYMDYIRKTEW